MSLITNYASNPKAVCTVKGDARVEFEGWKIASGVPSDGVVRLIFRGRTGKDTAFYQITCTEAGSDESFFTGGTMPLQNN